VLGQGPVGETCSSVVKNHHKEELANPYAPVD